MIPTSGTTVEFRARITNFATPLSSSIIIYNQQPIYLIDYWYYVYMGVDYTYNNTYYIHANIFYSEDAK